MDLMNMAKEQLAQDIHKISAMDERKVIENIIDVQNKNRIIFFMVL